MEKDKMQVAKEKTDNEQLKRSIEDKQKAIAKQNTVRK